MQGTLVSAAAVVAVVVGGGEGAPEEGDGGGEGSDVTHQLLVSAVERLQLRQLHLQTADHVPEHQPPRRLPTHQLLKVRFRQLNTTQQTQLTAQYTSSF